MSPNRKRVLTAMVSVLAIAGSALWIYWREFKAPKFNMGLHQRVGEVMAEETAKLAGRKGRVVLITIPTAGQPELKTQMESFHKALKKLGTYELKEYEMDTKEQAKYGVGTGLSGRRFVRTVNKNEKANVFVSFIGAPEMKDEEIAELKFLPTFIAESRSPDHLLKLFEKKIVQVAVVSRVTFPAPGPRNPKTPQEWFAKRYQIFAANAASTLPKPE